MHRKMEDVQKEKSKGHYDFENIGTLIRYGIYPSSRYPQKTLTVSLILEEPPKNLT